MRGRSPGKDLGNWANNWFFESTWNDVAELERTSVEYKSYTRGKKLVNFYLGGLGRAGRRKWFSIRFN